MAADRGRRLRHPCSCNRVFTDAIPCRMVPSAEVSRMRSLRIPALMLVLLPVSAAAMTPQQLQAYIAARNRPPPLQPYQDRRTLACFFKIAEGVGWCPAKPSGRIDHHPGGRCDCGGLKVNWPVNHSYLSTPGLLR